MTAGPQESAFVGVTHAGGAAEPGLEHEQGLAQHRPSRPLSSDSGISTRSHFSDEAMTSTGERLRFKIKDFRSKVYDKSIVVASDFEPKEGVQIAPGLVIHKFLAGGFQGGIYEVADEEGNVRDDCLLKVLKKSAVLGDLEKEWAIGQALNVLSNKNGYLVGFMKTYEAIRVEGESGIRGMLLERLNGRLVEDVVSDHKFSDALYLRDLLYQMCMALFRADTLLGFKHTDLRLTNIMEHYPDPNNPEAREFKIIDYGLATLEERQGSKLYKRLQKAVFSKLTDPEALGKVFLKTINPVHHFSVLGEAVYRVAWLKHNDVYHILASLSHFTDDRTWAEEDREIAEQYADLMKHVTGIKLRLKFLPRAELELKKAEKDSEVQELGYKINHAFADLKHFAQRFGSQAALHNHSDIAPQDALEHPLFAEHPGSNLGRPYHNQECDDLALFNNMEMLRGHSRVLPEDLDSIPESTESTQGDDSNGDDGDDDGQLQSWLRVRPALGGGMPHSGSAAVGNGAVAHSSGRAGDGVGAGGSACVAGGAGRSSTCWFAQRVGSRMLDDWAQFDGRDSSGGNATAAGSMSTSAVHAAAGAATAVQGSVGGGVVKGSAQPNGISKPAKVPINSVLPPELRQGNAA